MEQFWQLFTPRQLIAMTTLSDVVQDVRGRVLRDASARMNDIHGVISEEVKKSAGEYADAVATYTAFSLPRWLTITAHSFLGIQRKTDPVICSQNRPFPWSGTIPS